MNTTLNRHGQPVTAVGAPGSFMRRLTTLELEPVFSPGHQFHDRLFYDYQEGSYYDKYSDVFVSLEDAQRVFGLPH